MSFKLLQWLIFTLQCKDAIQTHYHHSKVTLGANCFLVNSQMSVTPAELLSGKRTKVKRPPSGGTARLMFWICNYAVRLLKAGWFILMCSNNDLNNNMAVSPVRSLQRTSALKCSSSGSSGTALHKTRESNDADVMMIWAQVCWDVILPSDAKTCWVANIKPSSFLRQADAHRKKSCRVYILSWLLHLTPAESDLSGHYC